MTSRTHQLPHDVLALPVDERAAVAAELLASLDDQEMTSVGDVEVAWAEEIERRARRVIAGESSGKSRDAVRRDIESNLGDR